MCIHLYNANENKSDQLGSWKTSSSNAVSSWSRASTFLPLWSHHEQSQNLIEGNHTLKLSTLHWVVSWLKVSYQPWRWLLLAPFILPFVLRPALNTKTENCIWEDPSVAYLLTDPEVGGGLYNCWAQSMKGSCFPVKVIPSHLLCGLWKCWRWLVSYVLHLVLDPCMLQRCIEEWYSWQIWCKCCHWPNGSVLHIYQTLRGKQLKGGTALSNPRTIFGKANVCYRRFQLLWL